MTSSARASNSCGIRQSNRLGGFGIDEQLEFNNRSDGQVGGLGAFEYFAGVDSELAIAFSEIGAHQPAGCDKLTVVVYRSIAWAAANAMIATPRRESHERAPPHSITSSARARISGGIVRPNAFAAVRLITSLKTAACWIGSSAGEVPLKILST